LAAESFDLLPRFNACGVAIVLNHPVFDRLVRKLERRVRLQEDDRAAICSLNFRKKIYEPGSYLVREGALCDESVLLLDGFTYRQKLTHEGGRQIVSIHIPGDFVDLEASLLAVADHNVQALTRCQVAAIPSRDVIALIDEHPRVARALWIDTLIDASIYREWVMNVGRRAAKQRIAHLLCEFAKRLKMAGLGDEHGYSLPMTQEQLADATGLTPVHVNRSLKALEAEGLIVRNRRFVTIPDWERLRDESGFSELYLHLDQAA
jgi:CRP-like cAMP-binding protein